MRWRRKEVKEEEEMEVEAKVWEEKEKEENEVEVKEIFASVFLHPMFTSENIQHVSMHKFTTSFYITYFG